MLYTGNGGTQTISGVGFSPAFVWSKSRGDGEYHILTDQVRGNTHPIFSNANDAEETRSNGITSFNSDGYALGAWTGNNKNNVAQVSWNWKGNGAGSTDTSGDIDAVVSANQTAGFSVVAWTGNGSNTNTVPHGLGVVPEVVLYKARNSTYSWYFWTTVIDGSNDALILNTTAAKANFSNDYGNFTSSVFPAFGFPNNITVVAYCFASKPSFSKIGVYTGNGNASGPFISTGFKPAWVMIKRTDAAKGWYIRDTAREPSNVMDAALLAQVSDAEVSSANYYIDYLSNGFKPRSSHASSNANGGTYLYMAFAESPFKYANAR